MCALQCFVFGPPRAGKSSLLRTLTRPEEATSSHEGRGMQAREIAVTAVLPMPAEPAATLILSEQSAADVERLTAGSGAAELASCDLGVFLFDSSSLHSMTEALQLLLDVTLAANNSLPCVLLAAKDDLGMSQVLLRSSGFSRRTLKHCPLLLLALTVCLPLSTLCTAHPLLVIW